MDGALGSLVHTDEAALVESTASGDITGSDELGTRSSAGEHALHTGGVVGSIPTASTIPLTRGGWPDWAHVLAPYNFSMASCKIGRGVWDRRYMYFIQFEDLVKVGIANDVQKRLEGFRLGCPRGLYLRGVRELPAFFAVQVERQAHTALKAHAYGREWFKLAPAEARKIAQPIIDRSWRAVHALDAAGYDAPQHD